MDAQDFLTFDQLRASGLELPPVHPRCRCVARVDGFLIHGEDVDSVALIRAGLPGDGDVWVDANDDRVCPLCLAYGASFNSQVRDGEFRPTDEQTDKMLDARSSRDYRLALERDSEETPSRPQVVLEEDPETGEVVEVPVPDEERDLEDRVLRGVGDADKDGIAGGVVRERVRATGETPHVSRIRAAVDTALEESRRMAVVKQGEIVEVIGPMPVAVPEAITATRVAAGVLPEYASAIVASGDRYTLVLRRERYVLIDRARDVAMTAEDSLLAALLLFLLLQEDEEPEPDPADTPREDD